MKNVLYLLLLILISSKIIAQSSIILPNGTVIPSFTQTTRPASPVVGQLIYQTDGTAGLYLWNGTTWTAVVNGSSGGSGTVLNVTANTPLSVTNNSTTPTISISQANSTTNGFLSSADWNIFNNKQNTLPNANTTTSGILTSADWNTFNNKQNTLPSANTTTSGILTSADWNTFNNKQNTLQNANTTTSGVLSSVDWNIFNNKQNNLQDANATTSGILTSADWNTFNNKFSLPPLNSGSLLFSNGITIDQNNSKLFWDNTHFRLGIGTFTPSAGLHIKSVSGGNILNLEGAMQSYIQFYPKGISEGRKGWFGFGSDDSEMSIINEINEGNLTLMPGNNGKVGIGTNLPESSALLDVNSTTKGFLPPRMTSFQKNSIVNPADGLIVYQTDNSAGIYLYSKGFWSQLVFNSSPEVSFVRDTIKFTGNTIQYKIPKGATKVWVELKGGMGGNGHSAYFQDPQNYISLGGNYTQSYTNIFPGQLPDKLSGNFNITQLDSLLIIKVGQASSSITNAHAYSNGTVFLGGWPNGNSGVLNVDLISEARQYTTFCGYYTYCDYVVNYLYHHYHASTGGGGGTSIALNSENNIIMSVKGGNGGGNTIVGMGGGNTSYNNLIQDAQVTTNATDNLESGYVVISYYMSNADVAYSRNTSFQNMKYKTASLSVSIPQAVFPIISAAGGSTAPVFGTTEQEWKHNLGYNPIIMISKEQANNISNMEYVSTSYYHVDSNTLRIRCSNLSQSTASGNLKIMVVN